MAKASTQPVGGWLFKEEPTHYSYADLERDGETVWSGITNAVALKNLRSVSVGDRVLFYQTGKDKAIVGEMRITEGPRPDPDDAKLVVVTVAPVTRWPRPVTLAEIKAESTFADWDLVRISRLSVMRVSAEQWQRLVDMSQANP
jgi:predicted RNA-binding protein with PUA-like domain